jgi:hypothetical protein
VWLDIGYVKLMEKHTNVANAVFPAPLGPTSRNVGRPVDDAAFRYKKVCTSTGSMSATRQVRMMVERLGAKAAVSQLS